jgi:hypothetical protein
MNTEIIYNLTQHKATRDQEIAGVVEPSTYDKALICKSLTFDEIPDISALSYRAASLAEFAYHQCKMLDCYKVMVGGAPFFMSFLEVALVKNGLRPLHAFSKRVSEEEVQPDGSVKKVMIFKHEGFVG